MQRSFFLVTVLVFALTLVAPTFALAQVSNTLQDSALGSLLVYPIFDIFGANRTKIRITNSGNTGAPAVDLRVRTTYVCQPVGASNTSASCPTFVEDFQI